MKNYKQLTLKQRYQIQSFIQAGLSQIKIASILGVHRSTISRELHRNLPKRGSTAHTYIAEHAHSKTSKRHLSKNKQIRLTEALKKRIESLLVNEKWSPELIAHRLNMESEHCVSHETIYKWIWTCKHSNHNKHKPYKRLYEHLKHNGRRQKRKNIRDNRGAIMKRVPISERPGIVEKRTRIGDIEVDLMMGSNHKSALLVMTDRTTLITMIEKLESKNANEVYTKMKHRLTRFNPAWIKTITFDNGKEVAYHYKIAKDLNVKTYFTRPIPPRTKELLKIELVLSDAFSLRKRILERYQNKE